MDYYNILGVNKNSNPDEIKKAYRKLAMENHPDRTGGDDSKFKQINEAYDTLKDPQKKAAYDNPQPRFDTSQMNRGPNSFEEVFSSMFGTRRTHKNRDIRFDVELTLEECLTGKNIVTEFKMANGSVGVANLHIDAGSEHGEGIRFRGVGDFSNPNIPRGDLLVVVRVANHPYFKKEGKHLKSSIDVDIFDLLKGTTSIVKTIDGKKINLNIPAGTNPGQTFKVLEGGLPDKRSRTRGHLYITVNGKTPKLDKNLLQKLEDLKAHILTNIQ